MTSYSLTQVAAMYLPADWKNPERWLRERLNRRQIRGYKLGNIWRMSQADVDDFLAKHRNTTAPQPDAPPAEPRRLSFTTKSSRRLKETA